jgi:Tfp pilus assembly PilM family ATPase
MFSALTQPRFPHAALGIEKNSLSAVALQGNRRQLTIKQAATTALAPGILEPSFIETNILDQSAFISALSELIEIAGLLKQKRWSVTLPSNAARTAILTLESEPAARSEADEILDWKAEQSFGAPAKEMRLSLDKIAPDKEGRSRFFTTAVKLSVIDEYESIFEAMGWKAGLILPRAVGEANWLMNGTPDSDSLLISANSDGFTALLLRGTEPAVVRSVTCLPEEIDDEIYRLVMFYNDRFSSGSGSLDNLLVIGGEFVPSRIQTIASEALGRELRVLTPEEVGLSLPGGELNFNDIAAPAGLAALGFG